MKLEVIINKNGKVRLKGFTKTNFKYFNAKKLQEDILFNLISTDKKRGEKKEFLENLERILEKVRVENRRLHFCKWAIQKYLAVGNKQQQTKKWADWCLCKYKN